MNDDQRAYLGMIQSVISRLAGNSFSIKGWAVALVAVLGGFAAKEADIRFVLCLWLPALCFWFLDAYYLRQERLYRALYNEAIKAGSVPIVYSMDVTPFGAEVPSVLKVAFSQTVLWLHIPILVFVFILSASSVLRSR